MAEFQIHDNDVKCGRGHGSNRHEGNIFYRKVVQERKENYRSQTTNFGKTLIAKDIVYIIHSRKPPGRFIEQDGKTDRWTIVPDEEAEKKVKQALREKESSKDTQIKKASERVATAQPLAPIPPLQQPRRISLNSSQASMQISRRISLSSSQTSTMMTGLHSSDLFDARMNNSEHISPCFQESSVQDPAYSLSGHQCIAAICTSQTLNHGTLNPGSCTPIDEKVRNSSRNVPTTKDRNLHTRQQKSEKVTTQCDSESISLLDRNEIHLSYCRDEVRCADLTHPGDPETIHSSRDSLSDPHSISANNQTNFGKLSVGLKSSQDASSLEMSSSDLNKLLDCLDDKEQINSETSTNFHIGYDDMKVKQAHRCEIEEQCLNQHLSYANQLILRGKSKKRPKHNLFNRKCHLEQQDAASDMSVASDNSLTLADLDSSLAKANSNHNSISNICNDNSGRLLDNMMIVDTTNIQLACSDSSLSLGDVFQTVPIDSTVNLPRVDEKLECLDQSGNIAKDMMDNSMCFIHDKKSWEARKQSSNDDEFWGSEISKMEASFQSSLKVLGDIESLC